MRRSLVLASQFLFMATLHCSATAAAASLALLPTSGPVQARVMQMGMPIEAQKTAEKLKVAFSSLPEWARRFIADNDRTGKPLPYHRNFRVTEDEYRALLAANKSGRVNVLIVQVKHRQTNL